MCVLMCVMITIMTRSIHIPMRVAIDQAAENAS